MVSSIRPKRRRVNHGSLDIIGIPKKFQDITLDDFTAYDEDLQKVKDYIGEYVEKIPYTPTWKNHGVFLHGSNGVGKTMLASIILLKAYMYRFSCKRITFQDYVQQYTRIWGAKTPAEKDELAHELYMSAKGVEYLVLEEVGKEIDSKVAVPILEELLRFREDKGLVTIICTNLRPSDIGNRYGNSVMSLIKGGMFPIKIVGEDRRLENASW